MVHRIEILFSSSKSCHDKEHKNGKDQNQREIRYLMTMAGIHEGSLTEEKYGNLSGCFKNTVPAHILNVKWQQPHESE
jgi:hypothetical protein